MKTLLLTLASLVLFAGLAMACNESDCYWFNLLGVALFATGGCLFGKIYNYYDTKDILK